MLTVIFCEVDDFCKSLEKLTKQIEQSESVIKKGRKRMLTTSDILTIIIYFHHSHYRTFKDYYNICIKQQNKNAFHGLVSYNRFVELMQEAVLPLYLFTNASCLGKLTGVSFIDSTKLPVCNNFRISSHKVFKGIARRGKTSTGWFFGFKLHLTTNEHGEILSFTVSSGNIDDRNESVIDVLSKKNYGKLFGDKGYLSKNLFEKLYQKGIHLFTRVKKNMKNSIMNWEDKILLRKRGIIESVINKLKSSCYIDHSRHRSVPGFFVNLFAGIAAYKFFEDKPSIANKRNLRLTHAS